MESRIIGPGEGRRLSLFEVAFRYGLESIHTGGTLAMLEVVIPPGILVKPHRHAKEDEYTIVLEGVVGVRLGDGEAEASAGSYLVKPRHMPHAIWNTGEVAARVVEIVVPGGLEDYFAELGPILVRDDEAADADYAALATRYGITIEDDWVADLEARYGVKL